LLELSSLIWVLTIGTVLLLLAIDLAFALIRPHEVGFGEATAWSVFYIAVAVGFGIWFTLAFGSELGMQFFAGYLVEKSLSVDNLFVFLIIMTTFAVPEAQQHKVLTFGILLALIMRAVFIGIGAALLEAFSLVFLLFGLLLIYTAIQLFRHRNEDPDIESNIMIRGARRLLPVTDQYVGGKFLTRVNRKRVLTPLFLVLIAIGSVDLLFALDSIPAVFGVTDEVYIVFTANAFALLGLRALFFLGVKLILHWAHVDLDPRVPEIPTLLSLGVILVVLAVVTIASLLKTRRDPTAKAHAGSLRATKSQDQLAGDRLDES
jgi:tellurite resistance protein TerC